MARAPRTESTGEIAIVLDAETLTPQAVIRACPHRVEGPFLGSDATYLACGDIEGHGGDHYFRVEWAEREGS